MTDKQYWSAYLYRLKVACAKDGTPFALTADYVASIAKTKCTLSRLLFDRTPLSPACPVVATINPSEGYVPSNVMVVTTLAKQCRETFTVAQLEYLLGKMESE